MKYSFVILLLCVCVMGYAHDLDIGLRLVEHYDDFHTPVPCHIHIYENGLKWEWDVTDETRLPDPDPEPDPEVAPDIEGVPDPEPVPEPMKSTGRHRLVLVLTEINIEAGHIVFVKACSNVPNYRMMGRLKRKVGRSFIEIPVQSRVYAAPVWNRDFKRWDEKCKSFRLNIPVSELLLVTDCGTQGDIFDADLGEGLYRRNYKRIETPTFYPYFHVEDGRSITAWKPVHVNNIAPGAPHLKRPLKLPATWGALKKGF